MILARETTLCNIWTLLKALSSLVVFKNSDASSINARSCLLLDDNDSDDDGACEVKVGVAIWLVETI